MLFIIGILATNDAISQDMRENLSRSLFSDQKANHVGDAVTILVVETSSASNTAQTTASRTSNLSLTATGNLPSSAATAPSVGATHWNDEFVLRPGRDLERGIDTSANQRNSRFRPSERKPLGRREPDDRDQWRGTNHKNFRR